MDDLITSQRARTDRDRPRDKLLNEGEEAVPSGWAGLGWAGPVSIVLSVSPLHGNANDGDGTNE